MLRNFSSRKMYMEGAHSVYALSYETILILPDVVVKLKSRQNFDNISIVMNLFVDYRTSFNMAQCCTSKVALHSDIGLWFMDFSEVDQRG